MSSATTPVRNTLPPITIRSGKLEDAPVLSRLMSEELNSRLTLLGSDFVLLIHQHMITSSFSRCMVAERENQILGYAAALTKSGRFYTEFLRKKGIKSAFIILPRIFSPKNLRILLSGMAYFNKPAHDDPDAELVSLVVAPDARRSGIGKSLFHKIIDDFRSRGIKELKITTGMDNLAANSFYEREGCEFVRSEPLYHDSMINVYIHKIV